MKVEASPNKPFIFEGLILTEGEDYIKIKDKYSKIQFITKEQIATVGEVKG